MAYDIFLLGKENPIMHVDSFVDALDLAENNSRLGDIVVYDRDRPNDLIPACVWPKAGSGEDIVRLLVCGPNWEPKWSQA